MANSIKFMNEGFESKYGNIKPDLCEQIYTVLKRLTEANMSPEDEADTKLLYSIYKKKMQNSNAELSPKELQVLDKYNLEEPRTSKDYRGRKDVRSSTRTDSEFRGPNVFEPVKRDGSINRKANLADRAKKMDARSNSRDDIGKYDKDYRLNYMYMKNAVNDKKYNQRKLDNLDREYDQEESNLRARLDALKKEREQEKSRYNSAINNSQYEINTLLKRESLLSEDKLTGFNDGEKLKHEINEFFENLVIRWNHEYDIQLTRADLDNAYEFVMLHFLWDEVLDESFKKNCRI